MSMPVCPFTVGTTYYKPIQQPEHVRIPCPVCNGNKCVTIILGTGEHLEVPCESCGLGFHISRGFIEVYQYTPRTIAFTLASIEGYAYEEWDLKSDKGEMTRGSALFEHEADALAASQKQAAEHQERNARTYSQTKASAKKMTWSIRYHRECIKDLEQKIAYHAGKIAAQKEGA